MPANFLLLTLAFVAFISLGLPDALLGIAWPFMRDDIGASIAASGYIVMATTFGAALSGFFSSWMRSKLGIGRLLALSSFMTGSALIGYTLAPSLPVIMVCGTVIGLAAGATDATVNGFVAKHFSDRLMQWLHASFGIGVTFGPALMTFILVINQPWQTGYQVHAGLQFVLAITFFITASLWLTVKHKKVVESEPDPVHEADAYTTTLGETMKEVRVWLSVALFFFYCGLEFSVGLWTFSLLTDVRGVTTAQAGTWVSVYWAMFTVGRIVMGLIANRYPPTRFIQFGIGLSAIGALIFALTDNVTLNLIALVAIGFAYAPIYPSLMSETMKRIGAKHFNNAMGLQVTGASLGVAILPATIGFIAAATSLAIYPWLLLFITGVLIVLYFLSRKLKAN